MSKLTKREIDATLPIKGREQFLWCGEVRGFGLRIKPSGTRTFLIQYRTAHRRTRRMVLGPYGALTVEQARTMAKAQLVRAISGEDPSAERQATRTATTVSELCDDYFKEAAAGRVLHKGKPKKASTLSVEASRIRRHIKPLLGSHVLASLTKTDIETFLDDVTQGKTKANIKTKARGRAIVEGGTSTAVKAVKLLSALFGYAMRKGLTDRNPCVGVELAADRRRTRYLTSSEYQTFGYALNTLMADNSNQTAVQAIRALALTGCRKSEILTLNVPDVDKQGRCLRLRDSKTGAQMRPCGATALDLLQQQACEQTEWVFPTDRGSGPIINIAKTLAKACELASLSGITAHTLRHSFATVAHELNYSELTIAGLLGHSAGSITARYAHHVDHALAAAADEVSLVIGQRLGLVTSIEPARPQKAGRAKPSPAKSEPLLYEP